MKTLKWAALFALMIFQSCRADEGDAKITAISGPAERPGMLGWKVDYQKPADQQDVRITLFYKFWDPKMDGDMPSEQKMIAAWFRKAPEKVSFTIFFDAAKSLVIGGGQTGGGKGCPLDASFSVANEPKRNDDGFYVLAQKPVDPKHPAAPGDTQNAAAWVELAITPK